MLGRLSQLFHSVLIVCVVSGVHSDVDEHYFYGRKIWVDFTWDQELHGNIQFLFYISS